MADMYDRNRRRRRKDRSGSEPGSGRRQDDVSPTPSKPPVTILGLAKPVKVLNSDEHAQVKVQAEPSASASQHSAHEGAGDSAKGPIMVLSGSDNRSHHHQPPRSVDTDSSENRRHVHSSQLSESTHSHENNPYYSQLRRPSIPSAVMNVATEQSSQLQIKLAPPTEKQTKLKLIDETLQWCDSGLDLMLEQTDFLVVGIVGLQGCGKSTILSLLAGNTHQDAYRNYVFFPQNKETKEDCLFQTSGIDMFVTPERVILLDTQPMLSGAVMDCMMRYERKFPSDYTSLQNYVEMQSMQLLTFLLSVCNIVLIADDWFADVNFLRFILDAEMLKPSTPVSSASAPDGGPPKEDANEFFPTIIFVHNKAVRDDFSPQTYFSMQQAVHTLFMSSKLKCHSGINMTNNNAGDAIIHRLVGKEKSPVCDINLLLLPVMEFYKCEPEWLQTTLPDYRGYPSFSNIFSFFRSQVLSAPRSPITHSHLTEKNWYHFAARTWESVKKSHLLAEYNRLLANSL